ncbi:MAG: D-tyrosyl-tRNA(Tyr) deacylase [Planctomycetes bacterium]|nr:D-tyrosyl-tRNA(Tyr) deacylase [Planctomycetota bacterium]MCB9905723.1 D-tyrosyl-tRNA(Tyr) deacylase [Planctomycetota bacterium]
MKAVVQRVSRAAVRVDGAVVGSCGPGALVLLGVMKGDAEGEAERLADRVARFRFFRDAEGRMNESLLDQGGEVLVVSQFTLAADGRKGRRPSFDRAAPPALAEELYEHFVGRLRSLGLRVETGVFGAMMEVELTNDGPVTFLLEEPPPDAP